MESLKQNLLPCSSNQSSPIENDVLFTKEFAVALIKHVSLRSPSEPTNNPLPMNFHDKPSDQSLLIPKPCQSMQ